MSDPTDADFNGLWGSDNTLNPMASTSGDLPPDPVPMPDAITPEQERQGILNAVFALGHHFDAVRATQHHISRTIEALTNRILTAPVPPQAPPPTAPAHAAPPSGDPRGAPRFKEPFVFTGSASEVEPWIDEISNAIHLQRSTLVTDYDKAIYLAGYLKVGNPKSWYYGIRSSHNFLLYNFNALIANFRSHFGDPNLVSTALHKLKSLKQTGSCASYASRSRELHDHLKLDDFTKINYFYDGLKEAIKDLLVTVKRKQVFDDFVNQCIEIDNRVHERERERKHSSRPSTSRPQDSRPRASASTPSYSAPTPSSQVVPMEIDAVKRGPITAEEKARRKKEGLCYYCAGKHRAANCPNMSAKAKADFEARRNAQSSTSSGKA